MSCRSQEEYDCCCPDDETSDDLKQRVISLLSKVGFEQQSQDVVAAKRIGSTTTQMALIEFKSAEGAPFVRLHGAWARLAG